MSILMTLCGVATIAGAGYIGVLSAEAMAEDLHSPLARWSHVWADLVGLGGASSAVVTGLYAILAAWLF